ncbi:terpenoid cyclases/Protein prenyltransferase [Canariomyces notabilis]|uniref:Protein farnesyltransferase subunit beta n=1 Tax=Canariomyces notabilis TaxID=2074819 RepID=A0AAN6TBI9_9PEZI|nr:terpenoid cyclases/Protein prenyltransferase [Canariomyces arenarius]
MSNPQLVPSSASAQSDLDSETVDEEIVIQRKNTLLMIPDIFTQLPPVRDSLATQTSQLQDDTVGKCLPLLSGEDELAEYNEHGLPRLDRARHVKFLHKNLAKLPGRFVAADSSRPWFLYWCLAALTMLGEDVSSYQEAVIETARSMQNDTGGFGGGNGQLSHMATTYAVVLALALVGGEKAFEVIDRRAMWRWLSSLKQPDGGFQVCLGGEEDIRGAYCASVIISLLQLPLNLAPESPAWTEDGSSDLLTGVAEYVRRCQTFEGGISGQPNAEAHGAYAFCALGCLALLDHPGRIFQRYLDIPRLVAWLSSRQYAPEGGFSGRTNKLVDGCYSHWVGGCFPLIQACLNNIASGNDGTEAAYNAAGTGASCTLPPAPETLFSREGLMRYILCCCQDQSERGGLRDKPGKMADAYHSCYVLAGLSSAQHDWDLEEPTAAEEISATADPVWAVLPHLEQIFDRRDLVRPIHPVYAIPQQNARAIKDYFRAKQGF